MGRAFKCYASAMQRLRANDRYLLNRNSDTYNFKALWLLMVELRASGDRRIPLPLQIPCSMSVFRTSIFRLYNIEKLEDVGDLFSINITSSSSTQFAISNNVELLFGATSIFYGRNYSVDARYASKKAAKTAVIEEILRFIDPDAHSSLVERRDEILDKLDDMKQLSSEQKRDFTIEVSEETFMNKLQYSKEQGRFQKSDEGVDGPTATVTNESDSNYCDDREYLNYITDSDVEAFLNGVLWVCLLLTTLPFEIYF